MRAKRLILDLMKYCLSIIYGCFDLSLYDRTGTRHLSVN